MVTMERSAGLAGCVIAVTLAVVGCGANHDDSPSASRAGRTASASLANTTPGASPSPDPYAPSVKKPPKITSDGITPLTADTALKGNVAYSLPGGIKAEKTLAIAINCQGPGRLTVQVKPTGISFPLQCEKGKVLPTMNEIHMSKNHPQSSLIFTAESKVTWSFAVGWDPHPPKQQ
ncbi:hypothetical protein ACQF4J_05830 [Streptomyces sp. C1-1]|uniref:hypothetical protein n=1 Tax=Streptomyces sp. C1-1 TaxID=3231173 RepID=UPI003D062359